MGAAAFIAEIVLGLVLLGYLLEFYRSEESPSAFPRDSRLVARWDFEPSDLGGGPYRRLALASAAGLFLELLLIRWISSEIPIFAYLKNFVLIACFLGFGLGCYLCRRRINLIAGLLPLVAVALFVRSPWGELGELVRNLHLTVGGLAEVEVRGLPTVPHTWGMWLRLLTVLALVVPFFAMIAFALVPFGQLVGYYLERACRGISGYTTNILASLAGILCFTLLAFLSQPPAVWLGLAGALLVALVWRVSRLRWTAILATVVLVWVATSGRSGGFSVHWSPYQKLAIRPLTANGEILSYELRTNGDWYQHILNLSPEFVAGHPYLFRNEPVEWNPYNIPYRFYPVPPTVLVLGAGMGNDVAAALRNGAGHVTAVDIDPMILQLGRQLHFEHPYSSPRVQVVNDDARSFLQTSNQKFDLILFSLLDSHTTTPYYSNIRIDNYVYTREAMEAVRGLLRPDGILVLKFWVNTPWIGGRLHELLEQTFGRPPLQFQAPWSGLQFKGPTAYYGSTGRFLISGSPERIAQAMGNPSLATYVAQHSDFKTEPARLTTDDWPYFYQQEPGLPMIVVFISAVLVPLSWLMVRSTGIRGRSFEWHFFFLGAGFLLLETQIISKLALLFGTTWLVNAVGIAGLLLLIVVANVLVEWRPNIPVAVAYAGICGSILMSYLVPVRALLFQSLLLKIAAATVVLCLPVFFAGVVFIRSFAAAGFRGEALGSNLFGALVGGLLESFSYWFGQRSLLVLAAAFYLASWVALTLRASRPAHEPTLEHGVGTLQVGVGGNDNDIAG